MLNPFDLPGPNFLLFYLITGIVTFFISRLLKMFIHQKFPIILNGLFLIWLAGNKIVIALSRGHHNILFLILLALVFLGVLLGEYNRDT